MRKQPGEIFYVASGIFFALVIVLIGTRFLTSVLQIDEYGKLALMISLASIFDQIVGHAIGGGAMRFYSIYQLENRLGDLKSIVFICLYACLIICIILAVIVSLVQVPVSTTLALLAIAFSMSILISGVGVRLLEAARRRMISAVFRSLFELARFGMAALFILLGSVTEERAMGGFVVGAGVIAFIHIYYIHKKLLICGRDIKRQEKLTKSTESFLDYAKPLLVVGLGTWVLLMSPLWAMGWFGEISEVGIYAAYHQLAFVPMLVISGLLLTYFAPILYEKVLHSFENALKDSLRFSFITLLMVILVASIAYIAHNHIAIILLGENFRTDSWIFPWLIIAGGFYGVAQQLLLRLRAEMKTYRLAFIQFTFAVVAIISYSIAAKYFDMRGVVYMVTAVNALLLITAFISSGYFHEDNMKSSGNFHTTTNESGSFE